MRQVTLKSFLRKVSWKLLQAYEKIQLVQKCATLGVKGAKMIFDKSDAFEFMKGPVGMALDGKLLLEVEPGEPKPILLVEDDRLCAVVACQALSPLGYQIDWVDSAEHALDKINQNCYCIVLANICLPNKSGIEMAVEVRQLKDKKKSNLPIVAFTGHTSDAKKKLCLEAGMQGVLHKPHKIEELKDILNRFASKEA